MCFSPQQEGNCFNCTKNVFNEERLNVETKCITTSTNTLQKDILKVTYTNADCLTKEKLLELTTIAEIHKSDIIAVTEILPKHSYFEPNMENSYNINGYEIFASNTKGRGVIILIKKELRACIVINANSYNDSIWVEIKLMNGDALLIGCIYRSPNNSIDKNKEMLDTIYQKLSSSYSHYLIMGDFNYKQINWELINIQSDENSNEYAFTQCINDLYLFQHVKKPTRYRIGNTPSLLDLILTNEEEMIENLQYNPGLGKSDHLILQFDYICSVKENKEIHNKYNFNKANYILIREKISEIQWKQGEEVGVQRSWEDFKENLTNIKETHLPISKMIPKKPYPYINLETKQAIHKKKSTWKKYSNCKNIVTYNKYKNARNNATYLIRKSKYNHEKQIAMDIKKDPKKFWKLVRNNTKTVSGISSMEINGSKSTDDQEISQELNRHFCTVFTKEEEPIPDAIIHVCNHLEDIIIEEQTTLKVLSEINPSKSQGPDEIHPRLLYECRNQLQKKLTLIYKESMEESKLPKQWKYANVTPIFKTGKKSSVENYRPISVTSICCRAMEKIIRNAIVNHLETNNLLSEFQHGFRKGKSCTTQLLECIEDWTKILDENNQLDVIYLDFKAAFDKVPHKRLLKKVWALGIRGKVYNWIVDFLNDRHQRVVINGKFSSWEKVTSGVPQGSVLGPVLFLIFINDIPDILNCTVKLFADDTKLYSTTNTAEQKTQLQENIFTACEWATKWQMKFNMKKCKSMHMGPNMPHEYFMKDSQNVLHKIQDVQQEKDLGVTFDQKLKFETHINTKINLANRNLGLIVRSFSFMNKEMFLQLYKSLVRPHLEYASVIWGPSSKKYAKSIENVQRRATRILGNLKGKSYTERLIELGLPTLEYRRQRTDLIQTYKLIKEIDKTSMKMLNTCGAVETRGHKYKIFKPRANKEIRKNCYSHRVINDWNNLKPQVVEAQSLNAFKTRLNKHWYVPNKFKAKCYSPN